MTSRAGGSVTFGALAALFASGALGACSVAASAIDVADAGNQPPLDAGGTTEDGAFPPPDAHADAPSEAGSCGPGLVPTTADGGAVCETPPMVAVTGHGGAGLAKMEVWTVVFNGDETLGASVNAFHGATLGSPYWKETTAEYGAGAGSAKGVIVFGAPPASVDDAFFDATVAALVGKTTTANATFTAPNPNTVVAFVIPKATNEPVGTSYHTETTSLIPAAGGGSIHVPYIVLRQDTVAFMPAFDYLTWTESHELVETASDPHPAYDPGWFSTALDVVGEIGDLCNDIPVTRALGGTTYTLTRAYSASRAAARLGDPCVPPLTVPYANVAISPLDSKIPRGIGQGGTVTLQAFSYGPLAPMHWALYPDVSYSVTPSEGTIAPGESVTVAIKRVKASPQNPTTLDLWVTSPNKPAADIPEQEFFAGITAGP